MPEDVHFQKIRSPISAPINPSYLYNHPTIATLVADQEVTYWRAIRMLVWPQWKIERDSEIILTFWVGRWPGSQTLCVTPTTVQKIMQRHSPSICGVRFPPDFEIKDELKGNHRHQLSPAHHSWLRLSFFISTSSWANRDHVIPGQYQDTI